MSDQEVRISGVHINTDSPDIQKARTVTGLRKLEIFSHLEKDQAEAAEQELATKLGIVKQVEQPQQPQ